MSKHADNRIVVSGVARTIEYAVCSNGRMLAREFIESLDVSDQRKLDVLFRKMAATGQIFNCVQFKQVEGKIYEFKRHQVRVGCFQISRRWLLTHGFIKKGHNWPKSELKRAERIMIEHLTQEEQGRL